MGPAKPGALYRAEQTRPAEVLERKERLVVLAALCPLRLGGRQPGRPAHFVGGHPAEAVHSVLLTCRGRVQGVNQLRVGPTPFQDVITITRHGVRYRPSEVALRDECGSSVLHHEWVAMAHLVAERFDLGPGLARNNDPRHVMRRQQLEGGPGGLPGVGLVIEQGAVEVGEKKCHVQLEAIAQGLGRPSAREVILGQI